MRELDPALQARLDAGATTLCRCWRVDRRDGVSFGFTDHDAPLTFEGVRFEASSGHDASATESAIGLARDTVQIGGALSSRAVTADAVARGLFDGAELRRWLVDWREPELRVLTFRGHFGEIRRGASRFEVEVVGLSSRLNRPVGRAFLAVCDAELGDARCRADLEGAAFRTGGEVREIEGPAAFVVEAPGAYPEGWFANGRIEWTTGGNVGLIARIAADRLAPGGRRLELRGAEGAPPRAGERFRLIAGCDKTAATCRDKFANFLNFRGFPHMPGDAWMAAYPAAGGRNDGGSMNV